MQNYHDDNNMRILSNPVLFRELMDRANDNLSIIDLQSGRFLYVNRMTCRSTGYTPGEFRKMTVADLDPTVTTQWNPDQERRRRIKDRVFVREGVIKQKDGTCVPVEIRSSIVRIGSTDLMVATSRDISERKRLVELLSSERTELKENLKDRITELTKVNSALKAEIAAHAHAEIALKLSEAKLLKQKKMLERKNITLSELLQQFAKDKRGITENITTNISVMIMPLLEKMRQEGVNPVYVTMLKDQIRNLASHYGAAIYSKARKFTSREIEIATMLKSGLSSKEISEQLKISRGSADWHRNNIRKKLGVVGKKLGLRSILAKL